MKIENQKELEAAFQKLDILIAEGFERQSEKEIEFKEIALAIERYEDVVLKLMPISISQ